MSKLLLAAFAVASVSASSALALSHPGGVHSGSAPLPDFPPDAAPGACYARVPAEPATRGDPAVWIIERGAGPTAVWRHQRGAGSTASGPLSWAEVDCATGRVGPGPLAAAPPPPLPPLAPPSMHPPLPPVHADAGPPPFEGAGPYSDRPEPLAEAPPMPPPGPMPRHGAFARGFGPGPEMGPPMPRVFRFELRRPEGGPPLMAPPPGFAPHPPAAPPAAPWFGGRMLTWPGKTGR